MEAKDLNLLEKEFPFTEIEFLRDVKWLQTHFLGNTLYDYCVAGVIFLFLSLVFLSRRFLLTRLAKAADGDGNGGAAFFRNLLLKLNPYVLILCSFYVATKRLVIPQGIERALGVLTVATVTIQTIRIVTELLTYAIQRSRQVRKDAASLSTNNNIVALMRIGVWTAGLLFLLDNLGFNVSTFVAGLGIGGAALALASQAILGDTFSSFAIALDRPFEVGDFIVVDAMSGTVEHIGLKTTRVRSISGELLIFSNSDLTKSRICNFQQMSTRRVLFRLGVIYQTPKETIKRIPLLLKEIVEKQALARFERAHFRSYGDSALEFEVVYFVQSAQYNGYMDTQQEINFAIMEAFEKENIHMAYPTQTIYVNNQALQGGI